MTSPQKVHQVVSKDEWIRARKDLLAQEKALTRQREEVSRSLRALPWVKVDQDYVFHGAHGSVTLAGLFAGRSQLVIYHFMFGPDWKEGCPSCSMIGDNIVGTPVHLEQRDTTLVLVSRAPVEKIEAFRKRMGWNYRWVSSADNSFNRDYGVHFTKEEIAGGERIYNFDTVRPDSEELPGISVFYKDEAGSIFHTYSAYARGVERLLGIYAILDMTPKGRDEDQLAYPMAWYRHHDRYPDSQSTHADGCCH